MLRGLLQKLLWSDYILLPSSSALFCDIGYTLLFVTLSWTTLKCQLNKSPIFLNLYGMTKLWLRAFSHGDVCSCLFLASFLLCEGQAHEKGDWEINASNFYIITRAVSLQLVWQGLKGLPCNHSFQSQLLIENSWDMLWKMQILKGPGEAELLAFLVRNG